MKKLTVFAYICIALFAVLLAVGIVLDNVWVAITSVLPLLIGFITVFHFRYFNH